MNINKEQIIKGIRICEAVKIELHKERGNAYKVKAIDEKQSIFEKMLREKLGK